MKAALVKPEIYVCLLAYFPHRKNSKKLRERSQENHYLDSGVRKVLA